MVEQQAASSKQTASNQQVKEIEMEKAKAVMFKVQVAVSLVMMVVATSAFLLAPQAEWVSTLEILGIGCAALLIASVVGQWAISSEQARIAEEQARIKDIKETYAMHERVRRELEAAREAKWQKLMGNSK